MAPACDCGKTAWPPKNGWANRDKVLHFHLRAPAEPFLHYQLMANNQQTGQRFLEQLEPPDYGSGGVSCDWLSVKTATTNTKRLSPGSSGKHFPSTKEIIGSNSKQWERKKERNCSRKKAELGKKVRNSQQSETTSCFMLYLKALRVWNGEKLALITFAFQWPVLLRVFHFKMLRSCFVMRTPWGIHSGTQGVKVQLCLLAHNPRRGKNK